MEYYIVCFDISNDRNRDKVCKLLSGVGERVQESVFEIALKNSADIPAFYQTLLDWVDPTDNLRLYRLCQRCRDNTLVGSGTPPLRVPTLILL